MICGPQNSGAGTVDDRLQRKQLKREAPPIYHTTTIYWIKPLLNYVKCIEHSIEVKQMKEKSPTVKIGIQDAYEVMEEIKKKAESTEKAESPKKEHSPAQKAGVDVPGRN